MDRIWVVIGDGALQDELIACGKGREPAIYSGTPEELLVLADYIGGPHSSLPPERKRRRAEAIRQAVALLTPDAFEREKAAIRAEAEALMAAARKRGLRIEITIKEDDNG